MGEVREAMARIFALNRVLELDQADYVNDIVNAPNELDVDRRHFDRRNFAGRGRIG